MTFEDTKTLTAYEESVCSNIVLTPEEFEPVDLVIGAFDGYTWKDIEPWVVSLERCGFKGEKAVIAYNVEASVIKKLDDRGFKVYAFGFDDRGNAKAENLRSIVVERFLHLWSILSPLEEKYRYIITTDVKDVIFQSNPIDLLETFSPDGFEIFVAGEGITYNQEPWSRNNMDMTFGNVFLDRVKYREIFCAGVIGGTSTHFLDLCMNIAMVCRGIPWSVPGGGGPDQAALNILLSQLIWERTTMFFDVWWPWCRHCGTTKAAMEAGSGQLGFEAKNNPDFDPKSVDFLSMDPVLVDGKLCMMRGSPRGKEAVPYAIVHQYNRVPAWANLADNYRE